MNFEKLPKVELHLHLDCSLSYRFVSVLLPGISHLEYREKFVAPDHSNSLSTYLSKALPAIELLQTKENLELAVFDLFDQLKKDNVVYAEIRFAPLEHTRKGLSANEVVKAVDDAMNTAQKTYDITARLILCTLRHYEKNESDEVADFCVAFKGSNVVALDIAGNEVNFSLDNHIGAFEKVKKAGMFCTAHAGEACGHQSVEETLDLLKPERIGHGVRSNENAETVNRLIRENIHLEICPKSNLLTGIYPSYSEHAINDLKNQGVSLSINTDGRTISNVSLMEEYHNLHLAKMWTVRDFRRINREAINHAFLPESIKSSLIKRWFEQDYD